MLIFLLAYLGGALTIASPCILPVLPFVFARAGKNFVRSGLPLLAGMALTFAAVATLAAVGGGWAVHANNDGRILALAIMGLFGVTLLFPSLAERLTRPLVGLGGRLSASADKTGSAGATVVPSLLLGVATGLLWAPCAGPILGLILTGAALGGASIRTSLLLVAYAGGAATSLAAALLIGGRLFQAMKRSLGAGEWIRRALGVAVLAGVVAIGAGFDTGFLSRLSLAGTSRIEQSLIARAPEIQPGAAAPADLTALASLGGAVEWINSPPLTEASLRGRVVLVDFWTYSCINCLRTLPYVRAWAEKYRNQGLVVIGVHAPEFAFEKNIGNVRRAVRDLGITYPVAIDNNYAIWRGFGNQFWPAHYFIDATGHIADHHFGEGNYAQSEQTIQRLLSQAGARSVAHDLVTVSGQGAEAASDYASVRSPETYIGYDRAANFVSPGGALHDVGHDYSTPPNVQLNQWGLAGRWTIGGQQAVLDAADGTITYRFQARDLHLVLGPDASGKPIHFRVLVDGAAPGADHGVDTDASGHGMIIGQRLYQLVRQSGTLAPRTVTVQFTEPGVQAYSFTFG